MDDYLEDDVAIDRLLEEIGELKYRIRELETALANAVEKLKKAGLS